MIVRCGVALVALAIDGVCGEPPTVIHPTAWMGTMIAAIRACLAPRTNARALLAGAFIVVGGGTVVVAIAWLASFGIARLSGWAVIVAEALLLKTTLSVRALLAAGRGVERALECDDLALARQRLAYDLVSRPTAGLDVHDVCGAAISSLAENLNDALIAPLIAYELGGLPFAFAYRFVNTADAMLGYRTPDLEWLGKTAARVDDLLNIIPARVAALLVIAVAPVTGSSPRRGLVASVRDARRTPSPNGGWPMAATAGAMGVRLEKKGVYVLNAGGRPPTPVDLVRARRLLATAAVVGVATAEAMCRIAR